MTDPYGFRLLDIDESKLGAYTLTVYQPGLGGALTHWLGEIDDQRRAHRRWVARWKAGGHTPPRSDPYRPQVRSRPLVFLETAAASVHDRRLQFGAVRHPLLRVVLALAHPGRQVLTDQGSDRAQPDSRQGQQRGHQRRPCVHSRSVWPIYARPTPRVGQPAHT
jgi:hypothetical protein